MVLFNRIHAQNVVISLITHHSYLVLSNHLQQYQVSAQRWDPDLDFNLVVFHHYSVVVGGPTHWCRGSVAETVHTSLSKVCRIQNAVKTPYER